MRRHVLFVFVILLAASVLVLTNRKMLAQGSLPQSMITRAVDDSQRVTLRGNVHPMARAEYDQGAAPSTMTMNHMLLILKRSPDQEAALQALNAQQQDKTSPNYHKWLTPAEFGEEFGPSDQDVTAITTWLGSHGFQVAPVANGRNMIDFSGTAGEVQEAFNTEIHHYVVNGKDHYANASEPQIPAALAPIVAGISSLNDFRPKPMHHMAGAFQMSLPSRKVTPVSKPEFTLAGGNCYGSSPTTNCYAMAPYDFATIYNLLPLWNANLNGTGEHIAIVSDSNINNADYTQFRTLMGLPAETVNVKLATGTDPGLQNCGVNTDEQEAILDVEWAGAVATGATIDFVTAPSAPAGTCNGASNAGETGLPTGYTSSFGGDYAAYYAIQTLNDPILSDSFGECELQLGSSGNVFYNALWQQAATQGITVLVATGDNGSAGCDNDNGTEPAQDGLQVDGTASTPYNVAVGGTDFAYITASAAATYWSSTNQSTGANTLSANGPIPETVYNDSCTNSELFSAFSVSSAVNSCNSLTAEEDGFDTPVGSSGGFSNCTTPSGLAVADCAGGYAKPSFQTALTASDSKRDIPDVSLFAGDGEISGTFYIVCEEDAFVLSTPPLPDTDCSLTPAATAFFAGEGGTSVSAQAFAGIVAIIDQKSGKREGNIDTNLYAQAGLETFANCNNSGSTALANSSTCIFKDVTTGTNSQACITGSTNCGTTISSHMVPTSGPELRVRWTPMGITLLACTLCAAIFVPMMPQGRRRWSSAFALLLFAAMFCVVSCGGGSGSSGGGGGGSTAVMPTVTGASPNGGPPAGGTQVVITGSSLSGATAVMFGGTAATSFTVNSATQITAVSPAETAGAVNITVTTQGGVSATSAANQFTFTTAPTVTRVSPNAGPPAGGTQVVITGSSLSGVTAVTFGGTAAANFTANGATQITAVSPAETAGAVNVTVTTQGGVSATSAADQFTFTTTNTTTVGVLTGYNAAVGYDRATGLGSVNAANLVNASGW